jgi:hypothetical protein
MKKKTGKSSSDSEEDALKELKLFSEENKDAK